MTLRLRPSVPWSVQGPWIALGATLVSILAHLVVTGWASSLLLHPKVIWVQAERPLMLDTPTPRPAAGSRPRLARPPQAQRGVPTPTAPPSPQATEEGTRPTATPAPEVLDTPVAPASPTPNDLAVAAEAPNASAPITPEPAPMAPDPGPLWLPGHMAQLPGSAQTWSYKVFGVVNNLTYRASSHLSYEPQPDAGYSVNYKVGAFLLGQRKQVSQGQTGPSGLAPRQFTDQSRRTQVTQVNVEQQTVKLPANPIEQRWTPGTQDRLSVFVQLGAWVVATPTAFDKGQAFQVPVWSSRDTETWLVVSQGTEKTPTPYGEREAVRLTRMPLGPSDARVDMWFVPSWGALPVRMEMVEANGNRAEQTLHEIEPAPPPQSP